MKDLSMHILDIVQNSVRAKASNIFIEITEKPETDKYIISIEDNGCGMNKTEMQQACDPFYTSRTTRKVGLGLSLLKQNAENTNGSFHISSEKNKGTKLKAVFRYSHIDRPILGDITYTLVNLFISTEEINFTYTHKTTNGKFEIKTSEIKKMLDGVPMRTPNVRHFLTEYLSSNLKEIQISE